ncbi:MAG: NUDIX domain-containing protein [Chloroflexota bacterium]|nr:NUDIX domain-containing protein [Chloroflexota bacterium]
MATIRRYSAAGGVVIDQGKMLLLDRPKRGEVRLPKGHIDPGEAPAETALRETTEESGYADLVIVADLGSQEVEFEHQGRHTIRTEYYYLMRLQSDHQVARDLHDAGQFRIQWTALDQAIDQLTYPSEQAMARKAISLAQAAHPSLLSNKKG